MSKFVLNKPFISKNILKQCVSILCWFLFFCSLSSTDSYAQVDQISTSFLFGGLHAVNVTNYANDTPLPSIHLGYARRIPLKKNPIPNAYCILQTYIHYTNFLDSDFYTFSDQKDYAIYSILGVNFDASFPLGFFDYKDKLKTFIIFGTSLTPLFWAKNSINSSISYNQLDIRPVNFYLGFATDVKITESFFINLSSDYYFLSYFPRLIDKEKSGIRKLFGRSLIAFKISGHLKW